MGTQPKPLEHRTERKVGGVWIKRDNASGRSIEAQPQSDATDPAYNPDTVARVKALAKAPAAGEPMEGDEYLRWLNG